MAKEKRNPAHAKASEWCNNRNGGWQAGKKYSNPPKKSKYFIVFDKKSSCLKEIIKYWAKKKISKISKYLKISQNISKYLE